MHGKQSYWETDKNMHCNDITWKKTQTNKKTLKKN